MEHRDESMQPGSMEPLRNALEQREQELRRMIAAEHERATVELLSDLEGTVGDPADHAFAKTRAGVETELVDRHLRELDEIEAARERMKAGTFGRCPDCGGPIAAARLQARPAALRCTDCQARHERVFAETR
jgi:RNA polymerase-binding transcription factor